MSRRSMLRIAAFASSVVASTPTVFPFTRVETPTQADLARFDRSRKNKKTSNKDWKSPQDPDAKVAKMKDGRTHLAHKVEHGVDMDTGAIVSVTVQDASDGDTATLPETLSRVDDWRGGGRRWG